MSPRRRKKMVEVGSSKWAQILFLVSLSLTASGYLHDVRSCDKSKHGIEICFSAWDEFGDQATILRLGGSLEIICFYDGKNKTGLRLTNVDPAQSLLPQQTLFKIKPRSRSSKYKTVGRIFTWLHNVECLNASDSTGNKTRSISVGRFFCDQTYGCMNVADPKSNCLVNGYTRGIECHELYRSGWLQHHLLQKKWLYFSCSSVNGTYHLAAEEDAIRLYNQSNHQTIITWPKVEINNMLEEPVQKVCKSKYFYW